VRSVAFAGNAQEYVGEYRGVGRGSELIVNVVAAADGRGLARRQRDGSSTPLAYLGGEQFNLGGVRFTFVREGARVARLRFDTGAGYSILTRR
jgi:hypothetical protein